MIQLVYTSRETRAFTPADLEDLLRQSRDANRRQGLTGMLLYKGGQFLQVLEGNPPDVDRLYDRIAHDPRHQRLVVLLREPIGRRRFADWTMGFRDLDDPETALVPGFTEFLREPLTPERFADDPGRSVGLLLAFRFNTG